MYSTVAPVSVPLPSQRKLLNDLGTRRHTEPEVFTFDRIPELRYGRRCKRKSLKVLYPIYQPRKTVPAKKDVAKRLLFLLLSIVALQVHLTTEQPDDVLVVSEEVTVETGSELSLPAWLLWMPCSTSALLKTLIRVEVNITCPNGHPAHMST
ncbi:radiation-inducible immediate-early gene IEX-1-like [Hypanus sabinus]|uniref:radiation-inducible immediate-early gene IEX-1-like n=1 Tax=Hypanus sabinus TaxID=79690 RepID=UPI0028C4A01E|nr:radiation-inducible immediate-early gene IEX-1-like [Hypanus sabinus]